LDGKSRGTFHHKQDWLTPDAIWNGAMSGYPVKVEWHLGHVWQKYSRSHWNGINVGGVIYRAAPVTTNHRLIVIPYWSPAMVFAILPSLWIWQFIKHGHRRKLGHCPKCNYDVRATPDRCPECGWSLTLLPSPIDSPLP
jgi:hypothetical protein